MQAMRCTMEQYIHCRLCNILWSSIFFSADCAIHYREPHLLQAVQDMEQYIHCRLCNTLQSSIFNADLQYTMQQHTFCRLCNTLRSSTFTAGCARHYGAVHSLQALRSSTFNADLQYTIEQSIHCRLCKTLWRRTFIASCGIHYGEAHSLQAVRCISTVIEGHVIRPSAVCLLAHQRYCLDIQIMFFILLFIEWKRFIHRVECMSVHMRVCMRVCVRKKEVSRLISYQHNSSKTVIGENWINPL